MTVELLLKEGEALTCDDCEKLVKGTKARVQFYIGGKCLASLLCRKCAEASMWVER